MAVNKKYYWLKLKKDFFNQKIIKKLRKIAGGDTYTIIYLKMQLASIQNEGKLVFEGVENTFAEELALELDEDLENINVTLAYLQANKLIEIVEDDEYLLTEVPSIIGSETATAERMRNSRMRAKNKIEKCNNVTPVLHDSDTAVTNCYTEKEIEKEIEIEKDNIDIKDILVDCSTVRCNYTNVITLYHKLAPSFPKIKKLSDKRKKAIKSRLNKYSIEDFEELFKKAEVSDFLKGNNNRNWQADFDWLIKDVNLPKVLEGKYDNNNNNNKICTPNYSSNDFFSQ